MTTLITSVLVPHVVGKAACFGSVGDQSDLVAVDTGGRFGAAGESEFMVSRASHRTLPGSSRGSAANSGAVELHLN